MGIGAPKQENWMAEHQGQVDGLMIGVGAGFDYYAENQFPEVKSDDEFNDCKSMVSFGGVETLLEWGY